MYRYGTHMQCDGFCLGAYMYVFYTPYFVPLDQLVGAYLGLGTLKSRYLCVGYEVLLQTAPQSQDSDSELDGIPYP